jgi:formylglycine-generating enzyme
MFGKSIPFVLMFLLLLAACSDKHSMNPFSNGNSLSDDSFGTLVLNISVAPWVPILAKSAAVQATDSVKVLVFSSAGNKVTEQRLTQKESRWQGSINVQAQNNMKVTIVYFGGSSVRYMGEKTGVNVSSGGSTTVDITLYYMGISITAPDSASADFPIRWTSRPFATNYQIQQDTKSDFSTATILYTGSDSTYTVPIQGKTSGQMYYFRARANTLYGYGPWYSKGGDATLGNLTGTIIVDFPDLPDEMGGIEVIQGITLVSIPGGSFQMGQSGVSEPVHTVTLSAFKISDSEVTQAQYKAILGTNPSNFIGDTQPVDSVSWWDAIKFCNQLSTKAGLNKCYNETTGVCDFAQNGFRLPTEAEWEYSCRAGTTTAFNTGDTENDLARAGWYGTNSGSKTHPVKQKTPNAWGLYDMHGNVWEWCNDFFADYTAGSAANPTGPQTGQYRILRSGSWGYFVNFLKSAYRTFDTPADKNIDIGFRVARRVP